MTYLLKPRRVEAAHQPVEGVQPAVVTHQDVAHVEVAVAEHQASVVIEAHARVALVALQDGVQARLVLFTDLRSQGGNAHFYENSTAIYQCRYRVGLHNETSATWNDRRLSVERAFAPPASVQVLMIVPVVARTARVPLGLPGAPRPSHSVRHLAPRRRLGRLRPRAEDAQLADVRIVAVDVRLAAEVLERDGDPERDERAAHRPLVLVREEERVCGTVGRGAVRGDRMPDVRASVHEPRELGLRLGRAADPVLHCEGVCGGWLVGADWMFVPGRRG